MGNAHSATMNHNAYDQNQFSDLYRACWEDDIDLVQSLAATSPFEMMNCHEVNGSTALHIAVECGHLEIVRLLLHEYGVLRHLPDSQGRTAFELAKTNEMRQLFHRSTTYGNRFCNEMILSVEFTAEESDKKNNVPSGRVEGHESYPSIADENSHRLYQQPDSLFSRAHDKVFPYKPGADKFISTKYDVLSNLVDLYIESTNKQYRKAKLLVQQYYETGRPDSLVRLYTLETSFYERINETKENSEALASAIYYSLRFLHPRAFRGFCFRGLSMTMEELKAYEWATRKTSRYLVTNTFCSATRDVTVARQFAEARAHGLRKPVLITFDFYSRCWTAVQLEKLSKQLPAISEIEDEQEVLILPRSTFRVEKVEFDSLISTIYLRFYALDQAIDAYSTIIAENISQF